MKRFGACFSNPLSCLSIHQANRTELPYRQVWHRILHPGQRFADAYSQETLSADFWIFFRGYGLGGRG